MTLNKMMIIGNLGADPELRYTPSGKAVTNLRVAVNDRSRGADGEWVEETMWIRVEVWEQAAERLAEQLRKGNKVYAEGQLRSGRQPGAARSRRGWRRVPGRSGGRRPAGSSRCGAPPRSGRERSIEVRGDGRRRHPLLASSQRQESSMPSARSRRDTADYYRDRRRRKVCNFCVDKAESIDYKEVNRLRRYLSERAKIEPRRKTGTCARHQRMLTVALKRARHVALLPTAPQHLRP
jgi:small subunit ribosomal protein S18